MQINWHGSTRRASLMSSDNCETDHMFRGLFVYSCTYCWRYICISGLKTNSTTQQQINEPMQKMDKRGRNKPQMLLYFPRTHFMNFLLLCFIKGESASSTHKPYSSRADDFVLTYDPTSSTDGNRYLLIPNYESRKHQTRLKLKMLLS